MKQKTISDRQLYNIAKYLHKLEDIKRSLLDIRTHILPGVEWIIDSAEMLNEVEQLYFSAKKVHSLLIKKLNTNIVELTGAEALKKACGILYIMSQRTDDER